MKTILFLLGLTALFALSFAQFQKCSNLNAIYEQKYGRHYKQFEHDFEIIDDNTIISIQLFEDADPKTIETIVRATSLSRLGLQNSEKDVVLMQQAFVDKHGKYEKDEVLLNDPSTRIFGASNIVGIKFTPEETQQRTIVSFLLPRQAKAELSYVAFTGLNVNLPERVKTLGNSSVIQFTYPGEFIVEEGVYDADGIKIRDQEINEDSVSVNTASRNRGPEAAVNVAAYQAEGVSNQLEFVATVHSQGSLKLVKYIAQQTSDSLAISKLEQTATLVVPAVESNSTADFLNGAQIALQNNDDILLLIHLHKDQVNAFNAVTQLPLSFADGQIIAPILVKYSKDLKPVTAVNLAYNLATPTAYASGFEVRDNAVVIAGNTYRYTSKISSAANQKPFVARVTFNKDSKAVDTFQSAYLEGVVEVKKGEQAPQGLQFLANTISFSIDGDSSRFVVGGAVADWVKNPYEQEGLAVLAGLEANGTTIDYRFEIGESGSNYVEQIKRVKRVLSTDSVEMHVFANSMEGPTTAPPADETKDPYRSVKIGFWQVDCKPRNMKLEMAATYSFFAFFGLVCVVFTLVVAGYSIKGIVLFIKDRQANSEYSEIH